MNRLIGILGAALALRVAPYAAAQTEGGAEFKAPSDVPTRLIRVLRTTNKAQTNRYVPKVYDLKNVNPYDVIRFIRRSTEIEEGAWFLYGKPEDTADPNGSVKSGKAALIVPIYQIPYLDKLMATIDVPGLTSSSGDEEFYYRPKNRSVSDPNFVSLVNAIIAPNHSGGDQVADEPVNAYLFYDSPSGIADAKRWLPQVDLPPAQVMVEATLYEVNVENDDALGLDYVSWKNGPGRDLFSAGVLWEKDNVPGYSVGGPANSHSYKLDMSSQFFDFLVAKNKARVLTSAKVLARHDRPALLEVADNIFYWRRNEKPTAVELVCDETGSPDRVVVGDQRERSLAHDKAGVSLDVTPLIGTEGITLDVKLDITGHTGFDSSGQPQLVGRSFDTELRVKDGEEVVLGGYTREMMVQQTNKIPVLGSIPILGWLFGGEQNLVKKRKVVVVLSATTVRDFSAMGGTGSEIDASLIRARARREVPVQNLATEAGFDQWVFDKEGTE
jgi:hypothetical protein